MKLFIAILTVLILSGCGQSEPSKTNIVSYIDRHELPHYLKVHSLKYKSFPSDSGGGRVSVSGQLILKEPLYQKATQKEFPKDYIDETEFTEKLPMQTEFGFDTYSEVLNVELSSKSILEKKHEAGTKLSFSGDLVFKENVDGYTFYNGYPSTFSYQPLGAKTRGDFNDPVVDIDNFIDATLLSLKTNQINCANRSAKKGIQQVLSSLQKSLVTERVLRLGLVTESTFPDLLIDITQLGLSRGLSFKKFSPRKGFLRLDGIEHKETSIRAEGRLEGISDFLKDLGSMPKILEMATLNVSKIKAGTYRLDLVLNARFNDRDVTKADIGLVSFSRCVELLNDSFDNVASLFEDKNKRENYYYLFDSLNTLFKNLGGEIEVENLIGNLSNPQTITLSGKTYGNDKNKSILEMINNFSLKYYFVQAVDVNKARGNGFSIEIKLTKK